ncbi:hypothetical protein B5S31_g5536 [[Candida] boidinii]|nr:hypothetical protein B5S31_g5536 [[Candida] boidinii]OWB81282.1 hypothetical protein B5S32_g5680 [[Candida] boidinii]GMF00504.1 unnamed protein product [[Candida] boidinii]
MEVPLGSMKNSINILEKYNNHQKDLNNLKKEQHQIIDSQKNKKTIENQLSKINNEKENLIKNFNELLTEYNEENTCLRYYINEYVRYTDLIVNNNNNNNNNMQKDEKEMNDDEKNKLLLQHKYSNVIVSIQVKLDDDFTRDDQASQLNFNIFDKEGNILRRKNNLRQNSMQLAISLFVNTNSELFNKEYIDICFENVRIDQSWKVKRQNSKFIKLNIDFGIPELKKNYEKSTENIKISKTKIKKLQDEVEFIYDQFVNILIKDEEVLRNINEDNLSNISTLNIVTIIIIILASTFELIWLYRYLKYEKLI